MFNCTRIYRHLSRHLNLRLIDKFLRLVVAMLTIVPDVRVGVTSTNHFFIKGLDDSVAQLFV